MSTYTDATTSVDLRSWELREKVAQLFIVGFSGTTSDETIREFVAEEGVGGVIYFSRNVETPEQVAALSRSLQRSATNGDNPPLLVTIDEEGGIVSRLPWEGRMPGQMTIGATRDPDLARRAAAAKARELRAIGVNVDLAPVLDANNNPDNPVIGVRSYGEDPALVSQLGAAASAGFQDERVVACGKHFPGHGDTDVDSHLDLPVIDHDRDRLEGIELAPFVQAVEAGIDAIMTTHVAFPTITEEPDRPATLSENVLTGLLREELEYDGLIVTDCLEMDAIAGTVGTPEAAVQTIEAGSDLVTVSHTSSTQHAAIDAVVEAVHSGRITEDRIDASVSRILETKNEYDVGESLPETDVWADANEASRRIGRRIATDGVTLVRDRAERLPITDGRVRVLRFPDGEGSKVEERGVDVNSFVSRLRESTSDRDDSVEVHTIHRTSPSPTDAADLLSDIDVQDDETVIACTENAASDPVQAAIVSELHDAGTELVVVGIRNPYDLRAFPDISTYLTTYDDAPVSLAVAADIVGGRRQARGTLPITIPDQ